MTLPQVLVRASLSFAGISLCLSVYGLYLTIFVIPQHLKRSRDAIAACQGAIAACRNAAAEIRNPEIEKAILNGIGISSETMLQLAKLPFLEESPDGSVTVDLSQLD